MEHEKSEKSDSITINKQDLWKYSTFVLAAILIIGAFVFFVNDDNSSSNNSNSGGQAVAGKVNLAFIENEELYPSVGPKDADVTILEVADFQCPYCAIASGLPKFAEQYATQYADLYGSSGKVKDLAEQGKIRFVYAPVAFLGPESIYASSASLCANEQGKFIEVHDAIYAAHDGTENQGNFNKDKLKVIVGKVSGMDMAKFNTCFDSGKYESKLDKIKQDTFGTAGVQGTPTFFVNGVQSSGSWSNLQALLKSEGVSA